VIFISFRRHSLDINNFLATFWNKHLSSDVFKYEPIFKEFAEIILCDFAITSLKHFNEICVTPISLSKYSLKLLGRIIIAQCQY